MCELFWSEMQCTDKCMLKQLCGLITEDEWWLNEGNIESVCILGELGENSRSQLQII